MRNIIEYKNLIWVDIIKPTKGDIRYLQQEFKLHPLSLKNIIPSIRHPDFDIFHDYISIILHYPRNEEGGDVEIHELDIIVGKNYLITNHYTSIRPLNSLLKKCIKSEELKEEYMGKGSGHLLVFILNKFLKRILEKTDKISEDLYSAEKEIFVGEELEMVKKIAYLKRRIISFWRATEPQGEVFYSLKAIGPTFFGQEYRHYFSDLFRIYKRIDNSLRTYKETIKSLEETNHSMVNLKRNEIIKILTIFSVILMPLTLLASVWGMNTNFLPFNKSVFDFWLIVGLMLIISSGMLLYFRMKKWL